MGIKHLLGFFLIIGGVAAGFLFLFFTINNQSYNPSFLYFLCCCAFIFIIAGSFILVKNQ